MYVDLGDSPSQDVKMELRERIKEVNRNRLSKEGTKRFEEIIDKHKSIFKIRLGSRSPAKIRPMMIILDDNKNPVKEKEREYSEEQRKFLYLYFDKLMEMGLLKTCPQPWWQAAPHLLPRDSKSKFRTTIDLRPVNAATKVEQRPMPVIETELSLFIGSTHFASLDFCSGYW